MNTHHSQQYLVSLVRELCKLPRETEWAEFKMNDAEPKTIGENISALANSAALEGKTCAHIVWGIGDDDHAVRGTSFDPAKKRQGNEELENWLLRLLEPKINFSFNNVTVGDVSIVLLEIAPAGHQPVRFNGVEFIRVGSYTKKLKDFPEKERALWRAFERTPFEDGVAGEHCDGAEVLRLLDYPAYFYLLKIPLPENRHGILSALASDDLIQPCDAGGWNITNMGGVLFAKNLRDFKNLKRKALRVIHYDGNSRIKAHKEHEETKGYASGFEGAVGYINNSLPAKEIMGQALNKKAPMFPELAVREVVANALIHQDFFVRGAGPMVEIFDERVEITNPGKPLVDTQRFLDTPPKSRNETLASLLRRCDICEERGGGIDKVVAEIELHQLPAPLFEAPPGSTRATLFAYKKLTEMDKSERIRACYLHACLKYLSGSYLTNSSLRERFGIVDNNKATVSRYIRDATEAEAIKPFDPEAGRKMMKYVPIWA